MEWLLVVVAGIIMTLAHMEGRKAGEASARKQSAEVEEKLEVEIADVKLEAEQNKPLGNKLRDMRERILGRRGDG